MTYDPGTANDPPDPTADELRMIADDLDATEGPGKTSVAALRLRLLADRIDPARAAQAHAYRIEHDYGLGHYVDVTDRRGNSHEVGRFPYEGIMSPRASWDLADGWARRLAAITGGDVEAMIRRPSR